MNMSKYTEGSTSQFVIARKISITNCIKRKTKLIETFCDNHSFPSSLQLSKRKLYLGSVHSWQDEDLDVFSYSRNTANGKHNLKYLEHLQLAIIKFNKIFGNLDDNDNQVNTLDENSKKVKKSNYITREELEQELKTIKQDNEDLKITVVEIYRAYQQINQLVIKNKLDDLEYQNLLRKQKLFLGDTLLTVVK